MSIGVVFLSVLGVVAILSGGLHVIDPERLIVPKGESRWWAPSERWRVDSPLYVRFIGVGQLLIGGLALLEVARRWG